MNLTDSILITGAGGMLGHAFADCLAGKKVASLSRSQLDISDQSALEKTFADHKPTLVLNCAAHTKVDVCEKELGKANAVNGYAVGHIASLCRASGAALVHISTDFVFDGSLFRPYRPTDPVNPLSAYGKSKLLGEQELQKNAPTRWLIVRTAWVYGRHGANFPRTMVQAAQAGKPLTVVSDQIGSPTHTPDLARAILNLIQRDKWGIFHITNSGQTSWFDFARATLDAFGVKAEISPITSAQWFEKRPDSARRPAYSVLDMSDFEEATGGKMVPWRAALSDYRAAVQRDGF